MKNLYKILIGAGIVLSFILIYFIGFKGNFLSIFYINSAGVVCSYSGNSQFSCIPGGNSGVIGNMNNKITPVLSINLVNSTMQSNYYNGILDYLKNYDSGVGNAFNNIIIGSSQCVVASSGAKLCPPIGTLQFPINSNYASQTPPAPFTLYGGCTHTYQVASGTTLTSCIPYAYRTTYSAIANQYVKDTGGLALTTMSGIVYNELNPSQPQQNFKIYGYCDISSKTCTLQNINTSLNYQSVSEFKMTIYLDKKPVTCTSNEIFDFQTLQCNLIQPTPTPNQTITPPTNHSGYSNLTGNQTGSPQPVSKINWALIGIVLGALFIIIFIVILLSKKK